MSETELLDELGDDPPDAKQPAPRAPRKAPQCKTCGQTFEHIAELRKHYLDDHPGQRSPGSRSKSKRSKARARRAATPDETAASPPADEDALAEVAPGEQPARRSWRERLWNADVKPLERPTKERKPGRPRAHKRESTADLWSLVWGGAGWMIGHRDVPVGRTLQLQAPAAGDTLDRFTRDTIVDKVLQPFARRVDETKELSALIGLPILVGMIERSPALAATLEGPLREMVAANITAMAPVLRRKRDEAAKVAQIAVDMGVDDGGTGDAVGAIIDAIFAPIETPSEPDAAAGNGARVVA